MGGASGQVHGKDAGRVLPQMMLHLLCLDKAVSKLP